MNATTQAGTVKTDKAAKVTSAAGAPVIRPVVRSFKAAFARECAAYVQAGGHGVYWYEPKRARLVQPVPDETHPADLSLFSILDIGKKRWTVEKSGPFKGLATVLVPPAENWIVKRRAARDAGFRGPRRKTQFDCLECGACCKDNEVILFSDDVERFREAGRTDLLKPPFSRRTDGKLVLTLLPKSDRCHHLKRDNKCGIYTIRPDACSSFPVASECCLYARESELGLVDGLPPEESV
jgi:uncharacterized protein